MIKKLKVFTLPIISFAGFTSFIACSPNLTNNNFSNSAKYYPIEQFDKSPFEDIQNQNSSYYKEIQKFLNQNYQWTQEDKIKYQREILPDKKYFESLEATLTKWFDGDTAEVKTKSNRFPEPIKIRFESIDTAETGSQKTGTYVETTGLEKKYAEQAKTFGKALLPEGSVVHLVFKKPDPARSFNRYVGNIYFGHDGFYKNYNVEIAKAGLAIPILSNISDVTDPTKIYYYSSIKQSASLINAVKKGYGFFQEKHDNSPESINNLISSIYETRGSSNVASFLGLEKDKNNNVFDRYEFALSIQKGK
ncbi:thermonuclease family protein [Mesomycoplasma conjunctivae]|uniref:thermonuclease family protein n=1 Tax=Mesomycoplasma conjunctivae TaxID=45361 RepID=UPI003DA2B55D